jgi:hypothetical protein
MIYFTISRQLEFRKGTTRHVVKNFAFMLNNSDNEDNNQVFILKIWLEFQNVDKEYNFIKTIIIAIIILSFL